MAYTRQDLLDLAAQTRALAQRMREIQHDEGCSRALKPALEATRHQLGVGYSSINRAAEHMRDDAPDKLPSPDLTECIDRIQRHYLFTDFRATDQAQQAMKARAALIYVLTRDEGFSIGQVAKALKRDAAAACKARDHGQREVLKAMNSREDNDIARYVRHMRAILQGDSYAVRDVVAR